jgi:hypothetical protein
MNEINIRKGNLCLRMTNLFYDTNKYDFCHEIGSFTVWKEHFSVSNVYARLT